MAVTLEARLAKADEPLEDPHIVLLRNSKRVIP